MPIKNIVGQKFGHLTVLKLSEKRNSINNKILWECQCDCGNTEIIYATTANLTQGYKTSCGCAKKQQFQNVIKGNIKDRTGEKYGKLTALYMLEGVSPITWHCKCDCGNEIDVTSVTLSHKGRTSCGCRNKDLKQDLTGERFGNLVVISRAENYISPKGQSQIRYLCHCDCGNEKIIHASSLKKGVTLSCGCIKSIGENRATEYFKQNNINFISQIKFNDCCDIKPLPFDFGIYNTNNELLFLIEINGQQHYEPKFSSNPEKAQEILEYIQKHDKIKEEYCNNNNINLLIIPYWKLNDLEKILKEKLKEYD